MGSLQTTLAALMMLGIASIVGCERGNSVPVEGRVTLNGKPLAGATVMFAPTRANGPGPFVGTTDSDGRFILGTVGEERSGAAVGEYTVIIATVESDPRDDAPAPTQKEIVPAEYRSGSKRFTIPDGGTKEANFDMKSGIAR